MGVWGVDGVAFLVAKIDGFLGMQVGSMCVCSLQLWFDVTLGGIFLWYL